MTKKITGIFFSAILCFSIIGNIVSVYVFDKALHYRQVIQQFEERNINEGLHLADSDEIRSAGVENLGAFVGGSLVKYWLVPRDFPFHIVNKGGIEEKISSTYERLDDTVVKTGAKWVLINTGFCEIHTAIHSDKDLMPVVVEQNFEYMKKIVSYLKKHDIKPIITTLTPVRPVHLLPYSQRIEIPFGKKAAENEAFVQYNNLLQSLAPEQNIPVIDLHKAMSDKDGKLIKKYSLTDGEHLNHQGYEHLSGILANELQAILN